MGPAFGPASSANGVGATSAVDHEGITGSHEKRAESLSPLT